MISWVEEIGQIESITRLDHTVARLEIIAPTAASSLHPGQFIMMRPVQASFLPRAMAPFRWDEATGRLTVFIRVLGPGTQAMAQLNPGDEVMIVGPLGRKLELGQGPWALIGRGVGTTPLWHIARALHEQHEDIRIYLSSRNTHLLLEPQSFEKFGTVYCHTDQDDPSGRITQLFSEHLTRGWRPRQVMVSGSRRLHRDVAYAQKQWSFSASVFVEEKMACGIGWCKGCATGQKWRLLCTEGPTIPLQEVIDDYEFDQTAN